MPAEIASVPGIMSGMPCVRGTRVPAMTVVAELRAGTPRAEIATSYPTLPPDAVEAVERWAEETLGPGWRVIDP